MTRFAILAALLLAGCGTAVPPPPDAPKVVYVNVPVPTSCVAADFPAAPPPFADEPESRKATQTFAQDYDLLDKGWPEHRAWETAQWDQIQACRAPPTAPVP